MALVAYLDWEVRTTGHDLNCSGFNPARDATNGVDYTQQDNAEITSLNWVVDSTNNTWIRSTELTNWVNSGKTLASLKGNHIHIAGKAIGGNTLFQWNASTAVPGAYYLQALGGGNPNWTAKPTRFWMNKTFVMENTSLPSGVNSWTYGDKDSLGYSTIYVRFGAENDANPNSKAQDDVIADGQTWTRGAYEIVNVGTDGNGPYLVLDRSPGAVGSTAGYGRIGGAMASPGGVISVINDIYAFIYCKAGTYYVNNYSSTKYQAFPSGSIPVFSVSKLIIGYDSVRRAKPSILPEFVCNVSFCTGVPIIIWCKLSNIPGGSYRIIESEAYLSPTADSRGISFTAFASYIDANNRPVKGAFTFCYIRRNSTGSYQQEAHFCIFADGPPGQRVAANGWSGYAHVNCVYYNCSGSGLYIGGGDSGSLSSCCVAMNCSIAYQLHSSWIGRIDRLYYYNCTNPGISQAIALPGNPFRDPDNGDFRLADNEAGRMLKQAGFQIPGPQGAPPMRFDAGAVQNSFYDLVSSSGAPIPLPMLFGV